MKIESVLTNSFYAIDSNRGDIPPLLGDKTMTEFTAILPLKIEVTIKAKSKDEAISFLDDLIANVTIDNYGKQDIEIVSDNTELLENDWELED
ncbi:MAG: hypothetical protein ACKPGT_14495 [Microcystis sp.]